MNKVRRQIYSFIKQDRKTEGERSTGWWWGVESSVS